MESSGSEFVVGWETDLAAQLRAALRLESWSPLHNVFVTIGLAWGLPVPLVTLGVECAARGLPYTPSGIALALLDSPWQWLFMAHPLLFAGAFGTIGTVARDRAREAARLMEELRTSAETDGLTGLLNHQAFQRRLEGEAERARRERSSLSVLMLDVDHFKKLNDSHGHAAGDQALRELARRLRDNVRPYDIVARYGGEEFAVILPGTDAQHVGDAAERLRSVVAERPFELDGVGDYRVTVSIGAASGGQHADPHGLILEADSRLYDSKRTGRNRVTLPAPRPRASKRPG